MYYSLYTACRWVKSWLCPTLKADQGRPLNMTKIKTTFDPVLNCAVRLVLSLKIFRKILAILEAFTISNMTLNVECNGSQSQLIIMHANELKITKKDACMNDWKLD